MRGQLPYNKCLRLFSQTQRLQSTAAMGRKPSISNPQTSRCWSSPSPGTRVAPVPSLLKHPSLLSLLLVHCLIIRHLQHVLVCGQPGVYQWLSPQQGRQDREVYSQGWLYGCVTCTVHNAHNGALCSVCGGAVKALPSPSLNS